METPINPATPPTPSTSPQNNINSPAPSQVPTSPVETPQKSPIKLILIILGGIIILIGIGLTLYFTLGDNESKGLEEITSLCATAAPMFNLSEEDTTLLEGSNEVNVAIKLENYDPELILDLRVIFHSGGNSKAEDWGTGLKIDSEEVQKKIFELPGDIEEAAGYRLDIVAIIKTNEGNHTCY